MPQLKGVVTKDVKQIWQSPDGSRILNEVTLQYQEKLFKANTYSEKIATAGWSGDIESYEKEGRDGSQTFVKQAPREGGWSGSGGGRSNYQPKDEKAIQAMWAIGQADSFFTIETLDMATLESLAKELMEMVDRVKAGEPQGDTTEGDDTTVEVDDKEPLDLSTMDEMLDGGEKIDPGETPWKST